jgi:soluble lytic murein transglycosylase-like protein
MPSIYLKEKEYLPIVMQAAQTYGVAPQLILAHIRQESNFKPSAVRQEPAINDASTGLMQILLKTAKALDPQATREKLLDPTYNIMLGTKLIAENYKRFPQTEDAVAAYNSGVALKDANGRYVSRSGVGVQNYVDRVMNYRDEYEQWLNAGEQAIEFSWFDIIVPLTVIGVIIYIIMRRRGESEDNNSEEG